MRKIVTMSMNLLIIYTEVGNKLYSDCKLYVLTFVVRLILLKVLNYWSNKSLDMLLTLLIKILSEVSSLPKKGYGVQKML